LSGPQAIADGNQPCAGGELLAARDGLVVSPSLDEITGAVRNC